MTPHRSATCARSFNWPQEDSIVRALLQKTSVRKFARSGSIFGKAYGRRRVPTVGFLGKISAVQPTVAYNSLLIGHCGQTLPVRCSREKLSSEAGDWK
jgi:hypothetical protein